MSYLYNIFFRGLTLGLLLFLSFSDEAQVQENDRAELAYTQRLSQQFPDSAFLLLKEMYSQSLVKKDQANTAICLQQMGQICYYLGNYPQAFSHISLISTAWTLNRLLSEKERANYG